MPQRDCTPVREGMWLTIYREHTGGPCGIIQNKYMVFVPGSWHRPKILLYVNEAAAGRGRGLGSSGWRLLT